MIEIDHHRRKTINTLACRQEIQHNIVSSGRRGKNSPHLRRLRANAERRVIRATHHITSSDWIQLLEHIRLDWCSRACSEGT